MIGGLEALAPKGPAESSKLKGESSKLKAKEILPKADCFFSISCLPRLSLAESVTMAGGN
jgi:hypothetical protein